MHIGGYRIEYIMSNLSRENFNNLLEGLNLLNRYIIDECDMQPINKVAPFSNEPEFASRAYLSVGLCWAERSHNCLAEVEEEHMKERNWRKEEIMGTDYWIFEPK